MKILVMEELRQREWIPHSMWEMVDFRYLLDQLAGRPEAVRNRRRIRGIETRETA